MTVRQRLTAAAFVVAASTVTRTANAQCSQSSDARDALRETLLRPQHVHTLRVYGITVAVRDSLVLVTDSTTCRKAVAAIAEEVQVPVGEFTLVLARAGTKYVADTDRGLRGFETLFVLDSAMRPLLPVDILQPISNFPSGPPGQSTCAGPEDAPWVPRKIRYVLTDPTLKGYREEVGLDGISADSVHYVLDAAVCLRAIAAIKNHLHRGGEHVSIALFRVGRFHWAESSWPTGGEYSLSFILDIAATRVLYPK